MNNFNILFSLYIFLNYFNMESKIMNEYTIYLYDLPKIEYSSQKLARVFKEMTEIDLEDPPTIVKDPLKIFYHGFMKIKC